jgi:peptide deformylase
VRKRPMKGYPIVQAGDPVLRRRARAVPISLIRSKPFQSLIDGMVATMRRAPGVGLAAPQIGVPLRVIVLEDSPRLMRRLSAPERRARGRSAFALRVFVNPVLKILSKQKAYFPEGCLSVPGYSATTGRYLRVQVTGLDRRGRRVTWRATGWPARILQHELDHLNGTLYIDRMESRTFASLHAPGRAAAAATRRLRSGLVFEE